MVVRFPILVIAVVLLLGHVAHGGEAEDARPQQPVSQAEAAVDYNDAWWEEQYGKIYDTQYCREIITNMEKIRVLDRKTGLLIAPMGWAIGMYSAKGECGDPNPDEALYILTDLAERGVGVPSVLIAHFYHIKHGAKSPVTQSWMERAKNAMPLIITENWRENFYQPTATAYQEAGTPYSPQLESIFSWGETTLSGDPENIFQFGINLVEQGTHPEDKVLGCRWLSEAETLGHTKARFQLGRQLALGDGVQI